MRARINSTGRKRILKGMASFRFAAAGNRSFSALIDLDQLEMPPDTQVVIEAYRQSIFERFVLGPVSALPEPASGTLSQLDPSEVTFRIKAIHPKTGQLVALGDRFAADEGEDAGRRALLPVVVRDLGEQPWLVERCSDRFQLVLNSRIDDAEKRLHTDAYFAALILPAALRQVLLSLWAEGNLEQEGSDEEDDSLGWLGFVEQALGLEKPEIQEADNSTELQSWIDDACAAFSRKGQHTTRLLQHGAQS